MPPTPEEQLEAPSGAVERANEIRGIQAKEREKLDRVREYWKGRQDLPMVIGNGAPNEVKTMARIARVNVCDVIVESLAQSLFVEGLRQPKSADNVPVWDVWQANRFDRRQMGIHRAALAYGTSYVLVLPGERDGEDVPVIRGASPRRLTAMYGENPDWPVAALEKRSDGYRLYDETSVYFLKPTKDRELAIVDVKAHGMEVCPVVRFLDTEDLDAEDDIASTGRFPGDKVDEILMGQVAPMRNLQDQIDLTSFNLLVAQHYSAFRQRWIIGWTGADENATLKAAASKIWTFDENPDDVKLGEFAQTDLEGYIKSREAALKYAATLSQTPVHELIGELINLSAEALAAVEAGRERKVDERKTGFGESWEQVFDLVGRLTGDEVPVDVEVRWRDTSARAFGAVVDGLGKLSQMLGIPPRGLWERIPGVTGADMERWEALLEKGDAFANLEQMLQRQAPTDEA